MGIENLSAEEKKHRLFIGAEKLHEDYLSDSELTIFTTALASEPFIELL